MELQLDKELINQILPTKSNIAKLANEVALDISNGWLEPFDTIARVEGVAQLCAAIKEATKPAIRLELEKYGKEGHTALNAKFELAETGVKYDYSADPIWANLDAEIEVLKAKQKEQETFLKALSKPLNETNLESGEIIERIPPVKTSTSSYKITLAK